MAQIELLAPARDIETGLAAINSGADAVYIGAPRFGARSNAGNSLEDISRLVEHAHTYWARVYVTVNTLLHDNELPQAVQLIERLYAMGVDAIIIQDVGLLEVDLPPIPLIASTQMHNYDVERIAFLEQVGIRRVILARELSLDQIRAIRARTSLELEFFLHGALCVCFSGQCYMSYAIGGRSGNRGECAQPCRRRYTLVDRDGKPIIRDRHLLSLRDLNLTDNIEDLLDAGITAFKIEGRLKDRAYIVNVVSWYRQQIDRALAERGWSRSSSGHSSVGLTPDVTKTFNRGFTSYFIQGRRESPGGIASPKMVGEPVGVVSDTRKDNLILDTRVALQPGDGLCWFGAQDELQGTFVNAVDQAPLGMSGVRVTPADMTGIRKGLRIYRNQDHAFLREVERSQPSRKIAVSMRLQSHAAGLSLTVEDEDVNVATRELNMTLEAARKPEQAEETARKQLGQTGNTPFECVEVQLDWDQPYFVRVAELNTLRREALDELLRVRATSRPVMRSTIVRNDVPYPEKRLDYRGNVLNEKAREFYRRHGVEEIAPAAEAGLDMRGKVVMRTRYCLKHQLGLCEGTARPSDLKEPLYLVDEDGHRYRLRFNCQDCEMEIVY